MTNDGASVLAAAVSQVFRRPHFSRGGLRLLRRRAMTAAAAEEGTHLTVLSLVMSGNLAPSFLPSLRGSAAAIRIGYFCGLLPDGTDFGLKKGPFLAL